MTQKPVRIDQRQQNQAEQKVRLVDFDRLQLPSVAKPHKGYQWSSLIKVQNLDFSVNVVWDSGAEGTSMSDICASRILRAQHHLPESERVSLVNLGRMNQRQLFFGFAKSTGVAVDVLGTLRLDGMEPFVIRVVPEQQDDLLISASDMDRWGFDPVPSPTHFVLRNFGHAVPRHPDCLFGHEIGKVVARQAQTESDDDLDLVCVRKLQVEHDVTVPSGAQLIVPCRVVLTATSYDANSDLWITPSPQLLTTGLTMPEGPLPAGDNLTVPQCVNLLLRNTTEAAIVLKNGGTLAHCKQCTSEEQELCTFLDDYVAAEQEDLQPSKPTLAVLKSPCPRESPVKFAKPQSRTASPPAKPRVITAWKVFVLALLSVFRTVSPPEDFDAVYTFQQQQPAKPVATSLNAADAASVSQYMETESYRSKVASVLQEQRFERYSHLTDDQFRLLRVVLLKNSAALYIEDVGVPITQVDEFLFDIELEPNAKPIRHSVPKLSPQQQAMEQHHISRAEKSGHLRVPTEDQLSGWAVRTHVVHKKGDPMGRWVVDFRPLNAVTLKEPIALSDCSEKIRGIASKRWKSLVDAMSGFHQLKCSERASRLMTIVTSVGLRQWTVLPFGTLTLSGCHARCICRHACFNGHLAACGYKSSVGNFHR